MKKTLYLFSAVLLINLIYSCTTLKQLANIVNCKFRMESVNNTQLAGVDIQSKNSFSNLNFSQIGKLTSAYLNKNIPLSFTLNVEARNPNDQTAAMTKFDWILTIDDIEMSRGTNDSEVKIPGNDGIATIPMKISFNLYEALQGESKDALLNFAFNLADASDTPTRIGLKIKPTIYVNSIPLTYPNYINVGTEFGGQ